MYMATIRTLPVRDLKIESSDGELVTYSVLDENEDPDAALARLGLEPFGPRYRLDKGPDRGFAVSVQPRLDEIFGPNPLIALDMFHRKVSVRVDDCVTRIDQTDAAQAAEALARAAAEKAWKFADEPTRVTWIRADHETPKLVRWCGETGPHALHLVRLFQAPVFSPEPGGATHLGLMISGPTTAGRRRESAVLNQTVIIPWSTVRALGCVMIDADRGCASGS
ncbi:hypothetical protein [Phytoactinopolyspora halotolerans]|uniref:Uncharacterized protein n=1 Tax=Phytoactinopolyspora halotolerans TaxID=1981512 RepID=A0A6L9S981_9ACTN|nr:hypothetical protein [Phytoactinopolyspora halotolerans]NEE01164.1 hypothetical protein [Phytoactinopolyspora halotolerans]